MHRVVPTIVALALVTALVPYMAQPAVQVSPDHEIFYRLDDGNDTSVLLPFSDGRNVTAFYAYGDPHPGGSNTGFEQPGTLRLLLWSGPDGLSLVVLANANSGGTAGTADLAVGLPTEGAWVVQDDPADGSDDHYDHNGASWAWASCCTDGGAFQGGLDGMFDLVLNTTAHSGLDAVEVLSADGATYPVGLGMEFRLDTVHRPLEPVNLSATAGPGARQITLSWDPPVDDGGATVEAYRVYRAGDLLKTITGTAFTDTGLAHRTTYTYQVSAVNVAGEGVLSGNVSATTWTVPKWPDVEADAGPGLFGQMHITWEPPSDDGGTDIIAYWIWEVHDDGERAIARVGPDVREHTAYTDTPMPGSVVWAVSAENAVGKGMLGYGCGVWSPYGPMEPVVCRY